MSKHPPSSKYDFFPKFEVRRPRFLDYITYSQTLIKKNLFLQQNLAAPAANYIYTFKTFKIQNSKLDNVVASYDIKFRQSLTIMDGLQETCSKCLWKVLQVYCVAFILRGEEKLTSRRFGKITKYFQCFQGIFCGSQKQRNSG